MIRANLVVGVAAAGMLALVLGVLVYTLGPGIVREAIGPGGGPARVGGTADSSADATPAPGGAAPGVGRAGGGAGGPDAGPPAPARTAPPAGPIVGGGGGGHSGATGGPVVTGPVAVCTPTLLQTMLGLVTATLGGGGAC